MLIRNRQEDLFFFLMKIPVLYLYECNDKIKVSVIPVSLKFCCYITILNDREKNIKTYLLYIVQNANRQ